jgi:hypothetical protein
MACAWVRGEISQVPSPIQHHTFHDHDSTRRRRSDASQRESRAYHTRCHSVGCHLSSRDYHSETLCSHQDDSECWLGCECAIQRQLCCLSVCKKHLLTILLFLGLHNDSIHDPGMNKPQSFFLLATTLLMEIKNKSALLANA